MAQAIPQHPANQKMDPARVSLTPGNVQLLNPLEIIPYHTLKSKENADKWYQLYELFCRPIEGYAGRAAGQVRIAVLDTGIDKSMLSSAFHENIKDNMSFLLADDAQDSGGLEGNHHGTQVVALLLSLAPWIHVYVARVGKDGDESMDPSCISKAIRYSVEYWDVHVISMSWGFRREHECISDAIRLAHSKDKIMFAAASNEGANLPARVTFPASMQEVICVNSCDGYGNSSDFNPPPREGVFNFSTLGEAVIAKKSTLEPKRLTGTSFATPAAAAIAASILEFATQKQILKEQEELKRHVATKDGMMKLLVAMSEPVSGFMYLRPWDLIKCDSGTPNCSCKSCRKDAEARLLQILKRDLPSVAGRTPFLGLPDRISSAAFDAKSRQNTSSCLPNTRVKVLDEIRKWADSEDTRQVYWLKGMAGTDECEGDEDLCLLIRCLASCVPPGGHQLRILTTSRPERPISLEFDSISTQERQHLVLHDVERSIVKEDLTEFYTHELNKINDRFGLQDLFCDTTISKMVQQSCGLFIYAAAVCRYIWQGGLDGAKSRLSGLVESKAPNSSPLQELDQLYTIILQNSIIVHSSHGSSEPSQWFRRVVGAIIVLSDTFSSASLCTFLGEGSLRPAIDNFHSVLNIPDDPEKPIGILHPSFRDFLLDPSRCLDSRFHINEQKAHQYLLDCCFRIMKNGLHYNMCNVDKPALRVHEISESFVRERIPYPVQYACRYWIHHLNHSGISSVQHVAITDFFRHCLLFWLETLAWTRNLVYAIEGVKSLRAMLADESGDISSMVHDASRFLSMHGVIIEQAPLQIYSSALLFSTITSSAMMQLWANL
ncbi:Vegetative incompatibility protein HET-E-1 [Fusarium oxysporum f. sp. cubense race 1]|uniref:Vegetative incompatibility protein HET-E-1 n=1 Tax=Fusarium oxysporum f. sp. cubense (strain race 1) TaxID=1229664 RepID=N4UX83_FUSC1|nr:Vegetative incompatibility protein HET-E-1 [Fusarium oxysporum f. sp. cubense race 1]